MKYKLYKIHKKVVHEEIRCICLQSNKLCDRQCPKDSMYYDQYKQLLDCFKNTTPGNI